MISIFTPTNGSRFLPEAYRSLQAQTDEDWEWVVLHNNGSKPLPIEDSRIKQLQLDGTVLGEEKGWVGYLKAEAVARCSGDVLLELDHDDMLRPAAIEKCKAAFASYPGIGFVYSNSLHCTGELGPTEKFNPRHGWEYRTHGDNKLLEPISFPTTPASLSRIWYAPNHFRAFRRETYLAAGGYAKDMRILDDQDLMCRMYLQTEFHHIDEALYVYRIHGENSWLKHNAEIQNNTLRLHDKYAEELACKWAARRGLRCLDLGAAHNARSGYTTVDKQGADINCDLDAPWPFEDNSVGVIRAVDILEHLHDPIRVMSECWRVLAPGGWLFATVPSTDGRGAFQDPTHVSYWNENSWLYYTHANWAKYIGTPVRFQAVRKYTTDRNDIGVCWTVAHLIALKDGIRPPGIIDI